jgi:hypothetical protein
VNVASKGAGERWLAAALAGIAVALAIAYLFRAPLPPGPSASVSGRRAEVVLLQPEAANLVLREQAVMRDTTPLFLPTDRNSAPRHLPRREPGKTFLDNDPPKLSIGDGGLNLTAELPPVVTLNGKPPAAARPEDTLAAGSPAEMLIGFGRDEVAVQPGTPRGAYIEIVAEASGQTVLRWKVPSAAAPPTSKVWQPLEFLVAVDRSGLVGPLSITADSQVEEVNSYFKKYLAQTFRIGERLGPGFYRIVVAP